MRAERSDAGRAAGRGYPSPRGSAPRGRATERSERERQPHGGHPSGRRPDPRAARGGDSHPGEARRPSVPVDDRGGDSSAAGRSRTAPAPGPGRRGLLAVLGVFLLTLAGAAADSYLGFGLGTITLVALTAGTAIATLAVRRGDLLSVVIAPPLVFIAVALVNIGLAPSASLNAATLATLLVRGFPAMGIATAVAVLLAVFRRINRR